MKNILIAIFLLFFTFSFAQGNKIEYPRIEKDAFGETVVIMTVPQAQKLDNDSDLLILYKQLNEECALRDQLCIQVVNDKDKVIASQTVEIKKLEEYADTKESQIVTLQNEINEYKNNISILKAQIDNRQSTISEKDLQIGILKSRFKWGGIGAGTIIAALTFLLVK
jgi:chromosome segregation ATPase